MSGAPGPASLHDAAPAGTRIVQPGRNCWRIDRADRFRCIQDAAEYFRLVRDAMLKARRTVFTLGWDTAAQTDLLPGETATGAPARLDRLLAFIARRRPHLRCYILTWDYGVLHMLERDPLTRWRFSWHMPPNVRFAFDDRHAVGGCHHQKVVVIDDQLAFCGGIDLTGHRWDTCRHRVDEPARVSLNGTPYGPYHEVQAMASGPVAASLGALARDRWRALGIDRLPSVSPSDEDLWPAGLEPDLAMAPVAIARTVPEIDGQPAVRECEALYRDSIALARQSIYIESQYFTDERLAGLLSERLREPDGPEVIVAMPRDSFGWLEEQTMGAFRDEACRRLIAADAHKRLRVVYPAASQSRDVPIFVHSKVMFLDDRLARIGSANFSKRSMGVDTECDLAVDAEDDPKTAAGIRRMRDRLLGEHLGLSPEEVAREIGARGSIRALIDACENADRTLARIVIPDHPEPPSEWLRVAADPDEPLALDAALASLEPALDAAAGGTPSRAWRLAGLAAGGIFAAGLAAWLWPGGGRPAGPIGAAVTLLVAAAGVRAWRIGRRAKSITTRHRSRAEFG
jgi:phosphatidylserine/phosphatidylglycerophosphate/cardiolipin synthase-like enzyme